MTISYQPTTDGRIRNSMSDSMQPMPDQFEYMDQLADEFRAYFRFLTIKKSGEDASAVRHEWQMLHEERLALEAAALTTPHPWPWLSIRRDILDRIVPPCGYPGVDRLFVIFDLIMILNYDPECLADYLKLNEITFDHRPEIMVRGIVNVACPELQPSRSALVALLQPGSLDSAMDHITAERGFAVNPLDSSIRINAEVFESMFGGEGLSSLSHKLIQRLVPAVTMDQVVLPRNIKEDCLQAFGHWFDRHGKEDGSQDDPLMAGPTVLLYGPPGTGKTMLAHALAEHTGRALVSLNMGEVQNSRMSIDTILQNLFDRARQTNEIVLIDEADDVFYEDSEGSRALLLLLEEVKCAVILVTNNMGRFDPALERRITMKYHISYPDTAARQEMWGLLKPACLEWVPEVSLPALAARYPFTGAQIRNTLRMAAVLLPGVGGVLTNELICRCADQQFPIFLTSGIVTMEDLTANSGDADDAANPMIPLAKEDARFIEVWLRERPVWAKWFPQRAKRGPIILVESASRGSAKDYAKSIGRKLGRRLVSVDYAALIEKISGDKKGQMLHHDQDPLKSILDRLTTVETLLWIHDDNFLSTKSAIKEPFTLLRLLETLSECKAVTVISSSPGEDPPAEAVWISVDFFRRLKRKECTRKWWEQMKRKGYPMEDRTTICNPAHIIHNTTPCELVGMLAYIKMRMNKEETISNNAVAEAASQYGTWQSRQSPRRLFDEGQ